MPKKGHQPNRHGVAAFLFLSSAKNFFDSHACDALKSGTPNGMTKMQIGFRRCFPKPLSMLRKTFF